MVVHTTTFCCCLSIQKRFAHNIYNIFDLTHRTQPTIKLDQSSMLSTMRTEIWIFKWCTNVQPVGNRSHKHFLALAIGIHQMYCIVHKFKRIWFIWD